MVKKIIKRIANRLLIEYGLFVKKDALLIGTPNHNNIGDSEIVIAEKKFLNDNSITYAEVTDSDYLNFKDVLLRKRKRFDIVLLHGGGNVGDEYIEQENIRRDVVNNYPDKRIVIFPQTIYFSKNQAGQDELNKTIQIMNNHKDLHLDVRERYSFDEYGKMFKNTILTPDIVLYEKRRNCYSKNGKVLLLFRNDEEKNIDNSEIERIKNILSNRGIEYDISDMDSLERIYKFNRRKIVEKKFNEIGKYSLVITDRLHGMVFSYITHTNCIATANYNNKVRGTYEWIKEDESIKYVENIKDIDLYVIEEMMKKNISNSYVDRHFYDELKELIVQGRRI